MRVFVLRIVSEHRKDGRASLPVRPSRAAPVARKSDALLRPRPPGPCVVCGTLCLHTRVTGVHKRLSLCCLALTTSRLYYTLMLRQQGEAYSSNQS